MADVYKFKVKLREMEEYIWRDIEITSVSTVSKLGYAILAAFEAEGSHLFCMKFGDERYEEQVLIIHILQTEWVGVLLKMLVLKNYCIRLRQTK